jgi:hypothetical protein
VPLYRLVTHDPPQREDFEPQRPRRAEKVGTSELSRTGLSHFATPEDAEVVIWKATQRVARVTFPANARIHIARTEQDLLGHYDVWIPLDLVEEVVERSEILD